MAPMAFVRVLLEAIYAIPEHARTMVVVPVAVPTAGGGMIVKANALSIWVSRFRRGFFASPPQSGGGVC